MQSTLLNKTYVVTGATSGIGLATTEALARAGANVIGSDAPPNAVSPLALTCKKSIPFQTFYIFALT